MSSRIWHSFVVPCCVNHETVFGISTEKSLDEIYSPENDVLTNFRKELIEGPVLPKSCSRCTECEHTGIESHRQYSNNRWGHLIDQIDIDKTGVLIENKFYLWDGVGYTNLCNLKCRMCPSYLSSTNREEEIKHNLPIKSVSPVHTEILKQYQIKNKLPKMTIESFNDINDFYNFFDQHIDYIEEIKFEGGEPLMMEQHYRVLELLIEKNKTDVILKYPTNLTKLTLKKYNVLDLWKQFKQVDITVSLDAYDKQNYYIRHPAKWDDIISNLKEVKTKCPHVKITISTTMQILNSFAASKLHTWAIENNIAQEFVFLKYPSYLSMQVLPPEYKTQIEEHWSQHKQTLDPSVDIKGIDGFLHMMRLEDRSEELPEFFARIKERDIIRKENLLETFPEFTELNNNYDQGN